MNFKRLLKLLLEGTTQSLEPVFSAASLKEACPEAFALLKSKRILQRAKAPENVLLRGCLGTVRQRKEKWFWISLDEPAAPWVEIAPDVLEAYKLSHRSLLAWLAECYGTSAETNTDGVVWSLGSVRVQGQHCQLLYYPGTASQARLMDAVRALESVNTEIPRVILLPAAVRLDAATASRWQERGLFAQHLYSVATETGFDLERIRLPTFRTAKPGYYFRRIKVGKGWQVGFNTTDPLPVPASVAMDRIWFLLRHPDKEFLPHEITNELAGLSSDRSHNRLKADSGAFERSGGTNAKSAQDLKGKSMKEWQMRLQEVSAARKQHGEESPEFREAKQALNQFERQHGVGDSYAGKQKKEGSDIKSEADAIALSIKRWIDECEGSELAALGLHLRDCIKRDDGRLSYRPQILLNWLT